MSDKSINLIMNYFIKITEITETIIIIMVIDFFFNNPIITIIIAAVLASRITKITKLLFIIKII